jgi:hypothetical protein
MGSTVWNPAPKVQLATGAADELCSVQLSRNASKCQLDGNTSSFKTLLRQFFVSFVPSKKFEIP